MDNKHRFQEEKRRPAMTGKKAFADAFSPSMVPPSESRAFASLNRNRGERVGGSKS